MKYFSQIMCALMLTACIALVSCNKDNAESDNARAELNTEADQPTNTISPQTASNNPDELSLTGQTGAQTAPAYDGPTTEMSFKEESHNFGVIQEGENVSHRFEFTNTGDEPLVITNAKGSCGCTVPEWPKEPIAPGESSEILVKYNSKGKKGPQSKNVTIDANVEGGKKLLKISATVEKPEEPAQ